MKNVLILSMICLCFSLGSNLLAEEVANDSTGNKKVIYTYKQFEKFDFDDLDIEASTGAPGDLSISPIHEKRFTNRLPYRKSFTVEIKKGIERVR
ncbi:MAG: hypothetical protein WC635_15765 [Bacteriovorax sp.]|jgi:hypothetical protein